MSTQNIDEWEELSSSDALLYRQKRKSCLRLLPSETDFALSSCKSSVTHAYSCSLQPKLPQRVFSLANIKFVS